MQRFGSWYESRRQYLHAMSSYRKCGDFDSLLRVVQKDAGILLASLDPQRVLSGIEDCPVDVLKRHPLSILVLMRSMFNWRQIPKMLELKALLLSAIDDNGELSEAERGNLLGACRYGRVHAALLQDNRRTRSGRRKDHARRVRLCAGALYRRAHRA